MDMQRLRLVATRSVAGHDRDRINQFVAAVRGSGRLLFVTLVNGGPNDGVSLESLVGGFGASFQDDAYDRVVLTDLAALAFVAAEEGSEFNRIVLWADPEAPELESTLRQYTVDLIIQANIYVVATDAAAAEAWRSIIGRVPPVLDLDPFNREVMSHADPLIERTGKPRLLVDLAGEKDLKYDLIDIFLALRSKKVEVWCVASPSDLCSWMRPDMLFECIQYEERALYYASVDAAIFGRNGLSSARKARDLLAFGAVPLASSDAEITRLCLDNVGLPPTVLTLKPSAVATAWLEVQGKTDLRSRTRKWALSRGIIAALPDQGSLMAHVLEALRTPDMDGGFQEALGMRRRVYTIVAGIQSCLAPAASDEEMASMPVDMMTGWHVDDPKLVFARRLFEFELSAFASELSLSRVAEPSEADSESSWFGRLLTFADALDMTNADFVEEVYRRMLRRMPDPLGLSVYTSKIDSGSISRLDFLCIIESSGEFAALHPYDRREQFAPLASARRALNLGSKEPFSAESISQHICALEALADDHAFDRSAFLDEVYHRLLSRPIDPDGYKKYICELRDGQITARDVIDAVRRSDEFRKLHPEGGYGDDTLNKNRVVLAGLVEDSSVSDRSLIESAFRLLLLRPVDMKGRVHYLKELELGAISRSQLARQIEESEEFKSLWN